MIHLPTRKPQQHSNYFAFFYVGTIYKSFPLVGRISFPRAVTISQSVTNPVFEASSNSRTRRLSGEKCHCCRGFPHPLAAIQSCSYSKYVIGRQTSRNVIGSSPVLGVCHQFHTLWILHYFIEYDIGLVYIPYHSTKTSDVYTC